jgi:DNA-binding HxlR family transcriptional regulator
LKGTTRFDEFRRSFGIAPNILSRRLDTLVESGILKRRRYDKGHRRHEYLLTDRGRDFRRVIRELRTWGGRHFACDGE